MKMKVGVRYNGFSYSGHASAKGRGAEAQLRVYSQTQTVPLRYSSMLFVNLLHGNQIFRAIPAESVKLFCLEMLPSKKTVPLLLDGCVLFYFLKYFCMWIISLQEQIANIPFIPFTLKQNMYIPNSRPSIQQNNQIIVCLHSSK